MYKAPNVTDKEGADNLTPMFYPHLLYPLHWGLYTSSVTSPCLVFIPLIGILNQNVVPLPSSLSNQIFPPDDSTIDLIRYSPKPVPSVSTLTALLALKNFWKMRACWLFGIP